MVTTITSSAPYSAATASISRLTFSGEPAMRRRGRLCRRSPAGSLGKKAQRRLDRRNLDQRASEKETHRHAMTGGEPLRFRVGFRRERPDRHGGARLRRASPKA